MFMDGGRRIFEREALKPKNLSETLGTVRTLLSTLLDWPGAGDCLDRGQYMDTGGVARLDRASGGLLSLPDSARKLLVHDHHAGNDRW